MKIRLTLLATSTAALVAMAAAPDAKADTGSFLDYYHSHGGVPWPDGSLIQGGYQVCSMLHSGASRADVLKAASPFTFPGMFDVAVDAAQHELCPDAGK